MFDKKVLCLGTNSEDTDVQTSILAQQNNTVNHGLIDQQNFVPTEVGFYHTTVVDVPEGEIYKLSDYFDSIILLDQPIEQWSSYKLLLISYKLICNLDNAGKHTVYKDNKNVSAFTFFENNIKANKSFCIHPWITYYERDNRTKLCPRGGKKMDVDLDNIFKNWKTDSTYTDVRQKMLEGTMIPEHCSVCYDYEDHNIESYRQYETREWFAKLNIKNFDDLSKLEHPHFYDTGLKNTCNIMCRSCTPDFSHLIAEEANEHKIFYPLHVRTKDYAKAVRIDVDSLNDRSRVYFMGGEPTIIDEVYAFMRECIKQNRTDFEFCIGTNGHKFSSTFIELSKHFSNMHFSISLDGYGKINDYWRHGSLWENIVENMHRVKNLGHTISSNTVPGIYNVTNIHLLFEFLDKEFPDISMYLQLNVRPEQSAFNHPNHQLVVESMRRCMETNIYLADGKSTKSGIDSLYNHYSNNPTCDLVAFKEFFLLNDRLDQIRNTRLVDYIPELDACRSLI